MVIRKRLNFNGSGLFFITTTVREWLPLFRRDDLAMIALNRFAEASNVFDVSVVAYVLMPSHFHALVGLKDIRSLSQYVRSFKSLSSKDVRGAGAGEFETRLMVDGAFAMWQPRFDDLLIYSEKQFRIKIEYIHNNPVRDGLVRVATDYRYSSARDWLLGEKGFVPIDRGFSWQR